MRHSTQSLRRMQERLVQQSESKVVDSLRKTQSEFLPKIYPFGKYLVVWLVKSGVVASHARVMSDHTRAMEFQGAVHPSIEEAFFLNLADPYKRFSALPSEVIRPARFLHIRTRTDIWMPGRIDDSRPGVLLLEYAEAPPALPTVLEDGNHISILLDFGGVDQTKEPARIVRIKMCDDGEVAVDETYRLPC